MNNKYLSKEEEKTIGYYDEFAKEWSEKHSEGTMFDPEMKTVFELSPRGKVLEIGVGHGMDASKLIKQYGVKNYIGCEPAKGLLKLARKKNPLAKFENISIYEIDGLNEKFDIFWASAMLIHIPKARLAEVLELIHKVIKTGGIGFISVMEGNADMLESRPGRHYSLWSQKEFGKALKKAGFQVLKKRRIETNASPWLTYIFKAI